MGISEESMLHNKPKHKKTSSLANSNRSSQNREEITPIAEDKGKEKKSSKKKLHKKAKSFSDLKTLYKQGAEGFRDKGKEIDNRTELANTKTSSPNHYSSQIAYSKSEGFIDRLNRDDTQNAFIRDCVTSFTINGKSFGDSLFYNQLPETDKNKFAKREPALVAFMAEELYLGDKEKAKAAYEALSQHYTQNPLNTRVPEDMLKALQKDHGALAFLEFNYSVDVQTDNKNETRVVTTFDITGIKKPPTGKEDPSAEATNIYNGIIIQKALLVKDKEKKGKILFKGLQNESLHFANQEAEELYLAGTDEKNKNFYLLNKNANNLLDLCKTKKTNKNIKDENLIKSIEKMILMLAEMGATSKNLSLLQSIVSYAKAILENSDEYQPNHIADFMELQQEISRSSLATKEKTILLNLLSEINYQRFLEELVATQNLIIEFPRLAKEKPEIDQLYRSLTLDSLEIVDAISSLAKEKKHNQDIPFYTSILDKTKFIIKTVQNELNSHNSPSQASVSSANLKFNIVVENYQRDAYILKSRTEKSVNILAESMLRLKGAAMLLLGSLSVGLANFTTAFGGNNTLNNPDSAYQLTNAGHALLFKSNVETKERKTKESSLGETIQAYVTLVKPRRQ